MIILQDSRERSPIIFSPDIKIEVGKLDVGDYGCRFDDNFVPPVVFERKGIGDLFGSLTKDYSRIKEEIMRAHNSDITLIIIVEGTLTRVFRGYSHSQVQGLSIVKTLFSLWARYSVIPVFVKDRDEMAQYIEHYFAALWRKRISKENLDK